MKIHVNDIVKVKLNQTGISELERQHEELRKHLPSVGEFSPPSVDEDGYSSFQLWVLMNTFGHMFSIGANEPFTELKL